MLSVAGGLESQSRWLKSMHWHFEERPTDLGCPCRVQTAGKKEKQHPSIPPEPQGKRDAISPSPQGTNATHLITSILNNALHTHTHTHTHVGFYGLRGLSIGVMVFILYKLYVLLPYTYPTPKLSPHRRRCISIFPQKTHSV